jgi:hypothetical protein
MGQEYFNLMSFFDGYVKNYRRLNIGHYNNRSMLTRREIEYFAKLGEYLGYDSFVEDYKPNLKLGRSRPMDLSWWKYDARKNEDEYIKLVLHLERENLWTKDEETIEKLFSKTEEAYVPDYVIGIQNVGNKERIGILNKLVIQKNKKQNSDVLMIYGYSVDLENDEFIDKIWAFYFSGTRILQDRKAICDVDNSGYWFMCFEEEYKDKEKLRI